MQDLLRFYTYVHTNWDASSFSVDAIAQTPTASTNKLQSRYDTGNHPIWSPLHEQRNYNYFFF